MTSSRPAIGWSWLKASVGLAYAAPPAIVAASDPTAGLALAIGVIPAAAVGLAGPRPQRALVVLVGAVAGISMFFGSLVAGTPVLAVASIFVLAVLVAVLAANPAHRLAPLVLAMGLPVFGAGLSASGPASGAQTAGLMVVGSLYAWLVSLLWPQRPGAVRGPRAAAPRSVMLGYGVQIGAAGAAAAAIGFASGVDHPGWACTAALLVSRPRLDDLHSRAVGRAASVLVGAVVACGVAALQPSPLVISGVVVASLVGASATNGSRWYVMPAFSTTIVLSLLLVGGEDSGWHWFAERVAETLVGVALALVASWVARGVGVGQRRGVRSGRR